MIFGEIIDRLRQDTPGQNLRTFIQDSSNSLGEKPNTKRLSRTRQPGVHLRRESAVPGMCVACEPGRPRPLVQMAGSKPAKRGWAYFQGDSSKGGGSNSPVALLIKPGPRPPTAGAPLRQHAKTVPHWGTPGCAPVAS
jgi:hypothetical protein